MAAEESWGHVGTEGEVKVGEHDVAVCPEENVLGLEVAVDETESVEVLESEEYFGGVEASCGDWQTVTAPATEEGVEVSPGAVVD